MKEWLVGSSLLAGIFFSPDQAGQRAFDHGDPLEAAEKFEDPEWRGVAFYRAGRFEEAASQFARRDSASAHYNRGNALVMLGRYDDAISAYDRALTIEPDWIEAKENRELAQARAEAIKGDPGEGTGGKLPPDEIVFDLKTEEGDQEESETEVANSELSAEEMQAAWLRKVETRPAEFFKNKFAFEAAREDSQ